MKQLLKEENEENDARALLEEMQKNVDEAHAKASETKQRLYRELEDFMYTWDRGSGRTPNISGKSWQMLQSNDTKSENLEYLEKTHLREWNETRKAIRIWAEKGDDDSPWPSQRRFAVKPADGKRGDPGC